MSWSEFAITPPGTIASIKSAFESMQSGLDVMLTFAKAQATIAKALASGANAQLLALEAGIDSILSDIEELQTGGLSGIIAYPYAEGIIGSYEKVFRTMTLSPYSALYQITQAFDDQGDTKRPIGVGNWGGIVIVGSVPAIDGFYPLLEALGNFFNLDDLKGLAKKIEKRWQTYNGTPTETVLSSGLDFFGITQAEIFPAYAAMLERVKFFVTGIKESIISASGSLDEICNFIVAQIAEMESIVSLIESYISSFIFYLEGAGIFYQVFPKDSNTIATIKTGLMADHPAAWGSNPYSVVFGMFGSDAGIEKLATMLGL